jgi:HK97 family phage major capsid protein
LVRYDSSGKPFYPAIKEMQNSLELVFPIPDEVAHDPFARNIFLPAEENEGALRKLQHVNDLAIVAAAYAAKKGAGELTSFRPYMESAVEHAVRAGLISPDVAGSGSEWVPEYFSATLIQDVYYEARLLSLIPRFSMTGAVVNVPTLGSRPKTYRAAGARTQDDFAVPGSRVSQVVSGRKTFDAEKLQIIIGMAEEIEEDTAIAVAPLLRNIMVQAMAADLEDAVVNGSVLLTDLDNANATNKLWATTTGVEDVRNAWDGLRKYAIADSATVDAGGTTAFKVADLLALKTALGVYGSGTMRDNCVYVVGPDMEALILGLSEVLTMDKYGPQATLVTGEIARIWGIPIVSSGAVYGPNQGVGLNASGVYDGVTQTASTGLLLHRNGFWLGDRRQVRVESERSIIAGSQFIVASWRGDFQKVATNGKPVTMLKNVIP